MVHKLLTFLFPIEMHGKSVFQNGGRRPFWILNF